MGDLQRYSGKNSIGSRNYFRDWDDWERSFFSLPFSFFGGSTFDHIRTDITDTGDAYLLEADLPGFAREDIDLSISGDTLNLRAQRHSGHEETDSGSRVIRSERSYGSYSRDFDISAVNADQITAKYENGVLKLNMPKKQQRMPESKTLMIE